MLPDTESELRPFSGAEAQRVTFSWSRATEELHFTYTVLDPQKEIVWPDPVPRSVARDGLWERTCFELFLGAFGAHAYREVNAAPSGEWAAYAFSSYRERDDTAHRPVQPHALELSGPPVRRTFGFTLELPTLRAALGPPPWRLQPTAVLETPEGLSYWAPSHPGERPDFHRLEALPAWDPLGR